MGVPDTMDEPDSHNLFPRNGEQSNTECFIGATYDKLSPHVKVLVALFAAMNSSSAATQRFKLPERLWEMVRPGSGGPLVGESEETNWLKGVCDGILLVIDYM